MLTAEDLKEIDITLHTIKHIKDDADKSKLSVLDYLDIAAFILLEAKGIFYTASGRPKNFIELVGSVGKIVAFVRQLVRMVNRDARQKKPVNQFRPIKDDSI
jgi:hypothetical protein